METIYLASESQRTQQQIEVDRHELKFWQYAGALAIRGVDGKPILQTASYN